jgi:primase-polymerase (primpol)-like protein
MQLGTQFTVGNIPEPMIKHDQWVNWTCQLSTLKGRHRRRKVPVDPRTGRFAKVSDESTWSSLDVAIESSHARRHQRLGIGFVFTNDDPFVGVDLDDCRDPVTGQLAPWSQEVLDRLATYAEVSPSGTGVKAIAITSQSFLSRRCSDPALEFYQSSRFFTVTGASINSCQETRDASDAILWLCDRYFPVSHQSLKPDTPQTLPEIANDHEVLRKAFTARNGPKFRGLWTGSAAHLEGSQSEADLSLCRLLAFWCGPCVQQIDSLFRQSGLFRSKWDEKHFSSGSTYGMETIRRAIHAQGSTFYRWPKQLY